MNPEYGWVLQGGLQTKTDKNTASVFRVFDLLYIHIKPYESELSTALSECKAVALCATRKTDTAINRIKTSETHKLRIENTSGRKQNKNRWGLQTVVTTRNIYMVTNRIKSVGTCKRWPSLGKQMPYVHKYNISGACKAIHWKMCHQETSDFCIG